MNQKSKVWEIAECAIMLAMSIALLTVSELIPWPAWLQGGGVSLFGQVPIIVVSYRRGLKAGVSVSLLLGVFQLITGLANFAWVKGAVSYVIVALFDYILAYGVLGFGGMFRRKKTGLVGNIAAGAVIVCVCRFVCHFLSGITVWSEYTQGTGGGFTNLDSLVHGITKASVIYSVTYNGGYMLPETIITVIGCAAVAVILPKELKKFLHKDNDTEAEESSEEETAG